MMQPYYPIIRVISKSYEIPQLGRKRRIAALLPHDYYDTKKTYPVLYLNDGQNLWEDKGAYGDWGVDDTMQRFASEGMSDIIVIGIDHGGSSRLNEYAPYSNHRFGEAEGDLYLDFLINTLMPYVEKTFRVSPGRENTGIGGSSMGGLISLYAGLKYPEMFSKLMIFSPSLWVAPKIYERARDFTPTQPVNIYLYAGENESEEHMPNVTRLREELLLHKSGINNLSCKLSVDPRGTHNERFWNKEFPVALKWLYFHSKFDSNEYQYPQIKP